MDGRFGDREGRGHAILCDTRKQLYRRSRSRSILLRSRRTRSVRTCLCIPVAILALMTALPASPQAGTSPAPAKHHFESPAASFEYSYPLVLCKAEPAACKGCESPSTVIACVAYN